MSKFLDILRIISFVFISLQLAACGGGGGSSGSVSVTAQPCTSQEDSCQAGISLHNVAALNSAGYTGSGIKIAVVDTGIHETHTDINDNMIAYTNGSDTVNSDNDASDDHGHGSHVAGIIAAEHNSSGGHGVAYDAQIYGFKAFNSSGS